MIIALTLTPFFVPTPDAELLTNMLIIYAAISVVGALLFITLAKEKLKISSEALEGELKFLSHLEKLENSLETEIS